MKKLLMQAASLLLLLVFNCVASTAQNSNKPVNITVDLTKEKGELKPIWNWYGHDEPNYTYMKDGKKLLSEIAESSPSPAYVRVHNLLNTGDGTAALKWGSTNMYTEDAKGNPIYNWRIVDSIFDTYIERGMKPLAQIGFMPEALSTKPTPYQHDWKPGIPYDRIITGWAYPPNDYVKWGNLCYEWVSHCVAKYGQKEVESWYWEVWNEPDGYYWKASQKEFFKLYDYAADGVKRALPTAKIGGCNSTGGAMKWLDAFIKHCISDTNYVTGTIGSPLDALLFHAKGSPKNVNGTVVMGIKNQLVNYKNNFALINKYPQLKSLPIIVGESDPEGCAACGMATNPENAYRNGTMYSSYTAASIARIYELADAYSANLIGAVNWSFEFENQPWFYGFRDLATNGVDKPVLNILRMFSKMKGQKVEATSDRMYPLQTILDSSIRNQTDIGVFAAKDVNNATVMVWNYHDKDTTEAPSPISIKINGFTNKSVEVTQYQVDSDHSNSYEVWKKMGSPQNPTPTQVRELEKNGMLQTLSKPKKMKTQNGNLAIDILLPRQGVTLLKIDWK